VTATVRFVDWPSGDVPEAFVRAGHEVVVQGGPDVYAGWQLHESDVTTERVTGTPAHVDLLYVYRPIDELPGLVEVGRRAGATVVCVQFSAASPEAPPDRRGGWSEVFRRGPARRTRSWTALLESASFKQPPTVTDQT
jgi:hypothetical protein